MHGSAALQVWLSGMHTKQRVHRKEVELDCILAHRPDVGGVRHEHLHGQVWPAAQPAAQQSLGEPCHSSPDVSGLTHHALAGVHRRIGNWQEGLTLRRGFGGAASGCNAQCPLQRHEAAAGWPLPSILLAQSAKVMPCVCCCWVCPMIRPSLRVALSWLHCGGVPSTSHQDDLAGARLLQRAAPVELVKQRIPHWRAWRSHVEAPPALAVASQHVRVVPQQLPCHSPARQRKGLSQELAA